MRPLEAVMRVCWMWLLVACGAQDPPESTDVPVLPPAGVGVGGVTTSSGTYTPPTGTASVFDCGDQPSPSMSLPQRLDAPRGYNDVAFVDGALVGWESNTLVSATDPVTVSVHAPGIDRVYKMVVLADGDIVAATEGGALIRVDTSGSHEVLVGGLFAYGLALGSDGMVYASTNFDAAEPGIWRVDPDTGDAELWLALDYLQWPRDIDFARDFSALYVGTQWYGLVLRVGLDQDLDPIGQPTELMTVGSQWHDTVEADACGGVWVAGLFPPEMFYMSQHGQLQSMYQWPDYDVYGHGWAWGDETGGWDPLSIYVALPDQGSAVEQVEVGVPGRLWPGLVMDADPL